MKAFLDRYIPKGGIPTVARKAGIHPNTVYSWKSGRNHPSTMMLVWFFRSLSDSTGIAYEQLWLDFIYTIEGKPNGQQDSIDILTKENPSTETVKRSRLYP